MISPFTSKLLLLFLPLLFSCSEKLETGQTPGNTSVTEAHQAQPTRGGIPWFNGSIEDAFGAARAREKPVFLYWGAAWCPPCQELKSTIFLRSEFIEQSHQFVPVYLDGDTEQAQKYGEKFGVYGYPTVIIFNPQGVEITRIPGGMNIQQYINVLELALNAVHPVSDLLQAVRTGESIRDDDWTLLASYSWEQDRGKALGDWDQLNALQLLAESCPARLGVAKSKLQMLALSAWAGEEERDQTLAQAYLPQLESILGDSTLSRRNLNTLMYYGAALIEALPGDTLKPTLREQIIEVLVAAIGDQSLGVLSRIDALYGWVEINAAALDEDERLSPPQQAWVTEQAAAAKSQLNSYQRHTGISSLWQLYYNAGLEADARDALREGMEVSDQAYYFMADMGYLEKESGNPVEAIRWFKKAWDAARGPATRIQWGTNYMFALLELSPDNIDEINAAGTTIFEELAAQEEGLYQRSRRRMDRLGKKLLVWAEPGEGEAFAPERRAETITALRGQMDKLCNGVEAAGEAPSTCENFLLTPDST